MTYAEKYVNNEYVVNNTEEFSNEFMKWIKKQTKSFYVDIDKMGELLIKFLQQEIKPVLSEDEKAILRNVDKRYVCIKRDWDNDLILVTCGSAICYMLEFNHLFQSIENGEEYNIKELLEDD